MQQCLLEGSALRPYLSIPNTAQQLAKSSHTKWMVCNKLTVPFFTPVKSWNAFILKRLPGPGVHEVRPDFSISQRFVVSVALPERRQLIPIIAIGSTGSGLDSEASSSSELFILRLLRSDHGESVPLLFGISFSTLPLEDVSASLDMV